MGLSLEVLRAIAWEHARKPFEGPVLTLGRQCVYATYDEAARLLSSLDIAPAPLGPDIHRGSNIPYWKGTPREQNISDTVFFKLLTGADTQVSALDVSDFETADIIHDMNTPVSGALCGRFGLIIDSGTLEHVFDIRQGMANTVEMLRPGGRVIHIAPANQYVNHGFFQFSPTFFFDFYVTNGFTDVRINLFAHDPAPEGHEWELFEINPVTDFNGIQSSMALAAVVFAEKALGATSGKIPVQAGYSGHLPQAPAAQRAALSLRDAILIIRNRRAKQYPEAESLLQKAADAMPDDPIPRYYQALLMKFSGADRAARWILENIIAERKLPEALHKTCLEILDGVAHPETWLRPERKNSLPRIRRKIGNSLARAAALFTSQARGKAARKFKF